MTHVAAVLCLCVNTMHELAMHTAMHTALLIIVHTVLSILGCTLHVAHSLRETPIPAHPWLATKGRSRRLHSHLNYIIIIFFCFV